MNLNIDNQILKGKELEISAFLKKRFLLSPISISKEIEKMLEGDYSILETEKDQEEFKNILFKEDLKNKNKVDNDTNADVLKIELSKLKRSNQKKDEDIQSLKNALQKAAEDNNRLKGLLSITVNKELVVVEDEEIDELFVRYMTSSGAVKKYKKAIVIEELGIIPKSFYIIKKGVSKDEEHE
ncbi:chaperonin cofactor prefoldin [Clostridium acetobutylicum]|uniref:Uncharacterized protein n=1 Tax=Clostridium acetobutylicum (strain ATCC 824 / DSM 792 / JCM 1419 / IAM 19013 / LMG 5710 / NBRC 13948 / NRRL B-527 / VKM B-1787 / 2291 / W) TaxID=272562 RepID=Q97JV2_CLOAB|nr:MULTISPECIES: hypothetical protein [Clostridium]AAK79143.1 Hypothetical protein CA_C1171 [Clostridium acetobutylicum ATCC 824]ADZ20221.1 Conserved hypothetical protein [Clostridium acetobutylicum EA 2018]AEI31678.1 hypothetical protein SMB_G1191 [Clostridium acetobutylicum DSM 1731]AWV81604.1 hypothetical protein DK921_16200 [Clostridium acetobutylicum]MBC2393246.1 hypothetical protein [Clostridium acetobutylicum]